MGGTFVDCLKKRQAVHEVDTLVDSFRSIYTQYQVVQTLLTRYKDGKDKIFISMVDTLLSKDEIKELRDMAGDLADLAKMWEKSHKTVIQM